VPFYRYSTCCKMCKGEPNASAPPSSAAARIAGSWRAGTLTCNRRHLVRFLQKFDSVRWTYPYTDQLQLYKSFISECKEFLRVVECPGSKRSKVDLRSSRLMGARHALPSQSCFRSDSFTHELQTKLHLVASSRLSVLWVCAGDSRQSGDRMWSKEIVRIFY
jgi:hypothetical protein